MAGFVTGTPRLLLRLEGAAVLVAAILAYTRLGTDWWLFVILFFVPDLSMLGYLAGKKMGAAFYNIAHWYALPLALIVGGMIAAIPFALAIGLVWAAHIGFDRALGYGLKYEDGFNSSHLGQIVTSRAGPS